MVPLIRAGSKGNDKAMAMIKERTTEKSKRKLQSVHKASRVWSSLAFLNIGIGNIVIKLFKINIDIIYNVFLSSTVIWYFHFVSVVVADLFVFSLITKR